jgi:hypothetical protein
MLGMDEPPFDFDKLVGPGLLLLPSGIEHPFDMVPYIHPGLILKGVDQRDPHRSVVALHHD